MKRYILPLLFTVFCANASMVAPATSATNRISLGEIVVQPTKVSEKTRKAAKVAVDKYKAAADIGEDNLAMWAEIAGQRTNLSPRLLLALSGHESSFNPKARSRKGAVGILQIMPKTWGHSRKELQDYRFALVRGAEILAYYRDEKCKGNLKCAVNMYNVGESNYAKGMRNPKYVAMVNSELRDMGGKF